MNPQCKSCRWANDCVFSLLWDYMELDECGLFELGIIPKVGGRQCRPLSRMEGNT